jgi:hypothetical protein
MAVRDASAPQHDTMNTRSDSVLYQINNLMIATSLVSVVHVIMTRQLLPPKQAEAIHLQHHQQELKLAV